MTISNNGKTHIKRYLASFVPAIGRSIAFGIGTAAEAVGDKRLQFETGRSDVILTTYDFVNNKLIFKSNIPTTYSGKINEIALYSMATNPSAGESGGMLITTIDSSTEQWTDTTTALESEFATTNAKLGTDALRQSTASGASKTDSLDVDIDLSGYSPSDTFVLAYNVQNAFTSDVVVRFMVDDSNYYSFSLGAQTAGYKITSFTKGTATITGTPTWDAITKVRVNSGSTGGAGQVDFDGLRIDDTDTLDQDYVMVARELLSTTFTKVEGRANEIEFALDVSL